MTIHKFDFAAHAGPIDRRRNLPHSDLSRDVVALFAHGAQPPKGWGGLRRMRDRWQASMRAGLLLGFAAFMMTTALAFGSLLTVIVMAMLALRPPP